MERVPDKETLLALLRSRKPEIAERFGIERMALFGSFARDEVRETSDVDIAVLSMRKKSYWTLLDFIDYLKTLVGRPVDAGFYDAMRPMVKRHVKDELIDV